ncbi:MAG: hypothetical protein Q8N63_04935 [Nanoarchaeota archaeon]|nr:hypothetical protein [Nanoarchaeota archaeon]
MTEKICGQSYDPIYGSWRIPHVWFKLIGTDSYFGFTHSVNPLSEEGGTNYKLKLKRFKVPIKSI